MGINFPGVPASPDNTSINSTAPAFPSKTLPKTTASARHASSRSEGKERAITRPATGGTGCASINDATRISMALQQN
jgi:hypothetical protein